MTLPYNWQMQINLKGHVIVLDEGHNIEDTCREAASCPFEIDSLLEAKTDIERVKRDGGPELACQISVSNEKVVTISSNENFQPMGSFNQSY